MTNTNPDSGSSAGAHGITTAAELAAVREARGWTVQEAAQRMRLATRQIQALEQGHWTELPGGPLCAVPCAGMDGCSGWGSNR